MAKKAQTLTRDAIQYETKRDFSKSFAPSVDENRTRRDRSNSRGRYQCVCAVRLQESVRQPVRTAAVNFAALSFDIQLLIFPAVTGIYVV